MSFGRLLNVAYALIVTDAAQSGMSRREVDARLLSVDEHGALPDPDDAAALADFMDGVTMDSLIADEDA